jgi:hypothetical protein
LIALEYVWGGDGEALSPGAATTMIRFSTDGAPARSVVEKTITLHVTDEDGLAADASLTVQIHVVDMVADETPVPCRAKPWLCADRGPGDPL